jgi:hypothetical protein
MGSQRTERRGAVISVNEWIKRFRALSPAGQRRVLVAIRRIQR